MFELMVDTVQTGTFEIRKKSSKILRAFLGSCVGVALVDKKNGIGGLLHILLPEPPAKAAVDEPEKYASTAMPVFLEAMYEQGAEKEELVAYVAGGSLVGHVSMMDLRLDIGGQSAEVVANYLKLEGVSIARTETGGYISSQISLDVSTLECTIEPILNLHPSFGQSPETGAEDINIENVINQIKPIPQIALKVIRYINNSNQSMSSIAEEIRQDQILTAKVLQLGNSAYLNMGKKITSIDRALVLLGEKRILLLTLSVFTEMFYQQSEQGYSLTKGGLFHHAIRTASLADKLAVFTHLVSPDEAYTAGLLHDIGKTALDQAMAAEYPLFYQKIFSDTNLSILDIEKEIFGYTHTEIGDILAERWDLPDILAETICFHHEPDKAILNPQLTHLIYLANTLINSFSSGSSISNANSGNLSQTLDVLQLTSVKLSEFIDSIDWKEIHNLGL